MSTPEDLFEGIRSNGASDVQLLSFASLCPVCHPPQNQDPGSDPRLSERRRRNPRSSNPGGRMNSGVCFGVRGRVACRVRDAEQAAPSPPHAGAAEVQLRSLHRPLLHLPATPATRSRGQEASTARRASASLACHPHAGQPRQGASPRALRKICRRIDADLAASDAGERAAPRQAPARRWGGGRGRRVRADAELHAPAP